MLASPDALPGNAAFREGKHRSSDAILQLHRMPAQRQAEVLGTLMHAQLTVLYNSLHYAPFLLGIGVAGNASSLPPLVLRSMLKQRRILMRMH